MKNLWIGWSNPLEPTLQPIALWSRIQPPIRTRRRGRTKNPRCEPSAFETTLSNLTEKERSNTQESTLDVFPNTSTPSSQPTLSSQPTPSFQPNPKKFPKKRQRKHPLHSDHAEEPPNIASHTSTSFSQPHPTPLPKKRQ